MFRFKNKTFLISLVVFLIFSHCSVDTKPYFGLNPPSDTAEIFAPGIVSLEDRYEFGISFSPELDEVYFSVSLLNRWAHVYSSQFIKGEWTKPDLINFTKNNRAEEMEAFVSPDGKKIFFTAYDTLDFRIWFAERNKKGIGNAQILDSPINSGDMVFYSNMAKNGDLYYTNASKNKLYFSPYIEGKYSDTIDAGIKYGIHGFISPDQDFILIDAFKDNKAVPGSNRDIHVCFKDENGNWGKPIILDESVNSEYDETCPSLSPDGKYLFFSRYNDIGGKSDIYWIDAELIRKLKGSGS